MVDAGRAAIWSRVQAVAWLAFRSVDAVRAAHRFEEGVVPSNNPFLSLAQAAAIEDFRLVTGKVRPGRRVRAAMLTLDWLERTGRVAPDATGRFRSADIRGLVRSKEGPGHAPTLKPKFSPARVRRLGWLFLTTQRADGLTWCKDNAIVTTERQ